MTAFAFVQAGYHHTCPGYINLSSSPKGAVLTVRTPGQSQSSALELPEKELAKLHIALSALLRMGDADTNLG